MYRLNHRRRVLCGILTCVCWLGFAQANPQPQYVGIPSTSFNFVAASQHTPMWCWAACIEMVYRYYGLVVPQEDIVARTLGTDVMGNPPPFGASVQQITMNLCGQGVDRSGRRYRVDCRAANGSLPDSEYLTELGRQKPLIMAYGSSLDSGHAVVLTAASYVPTIYGDRIHTLVVRDPFPTPQNIATLGRVEYLNHAPPPQGLPAPVRMVWFVDIQVES